MYTFIYYYYYSTNSSTTSIGAIVIHWLLAMYSYYNSKLAPVFGVLGCMYNKVLVLAEIWSQHHHMIIWSYIYILLL